ncbi:hypothetical protein [Pedobacter sp. GR22-10]|uniref:hypothetical protein n=1 Tax=Pedobacter sp. GR22-10 TaxID=2994472 RepID=UPI0022459CC2|nr:hypothetical protein [Pedobacter sp. GR22-10]MCX2430491.1 hypothetical protein [Pedobacter sp. GR22-10]
MIDSIDKIITNIMEHIDVKTPEISQMVSYDWWEKFLSVTNNRTQTAVIKNAISIDDTNLLSGEILHVIQELCRLRTNKYGYRVYVDDKLVKDDYLNYIFDNPPLPLEDVDQYADRVFKDQNFGMIINGCEKFSDPLSKKLIELISPLLEIVGIPMVGLSVHTFVGNYGYTPLGIHKDNPGENVIHFHLGPGRKTMYNWSDEVYEQINGKKKNEDKDFESLLPYAELYNFEKGDVYFMPWNKFHLGKTDGLSIGATVWFNNPPKKKLFDKIISSLSQQYMVNDDSLKDIMTPVKDPYGQETLDELRDLLVVDENILNLSFNDAFKVLHDDYKLALFSNSGWKTRTTSLSDEKLFDVDNYILLKDRIIKLTQPFKIYSRRSIDGEEIIIFARGSKLKMRYHPEIENIIHELNKGEEVNSAKLIEKLSVEWPEDAGLYILGLLYDKRAIEFNA